MNTENLIANPDPQVPVTLPLSAWVSLGDALGRYVPFNEAAPHIVAIGAQIAPHIQAAQAAVQTLAAADAAAPDAAARVQ